MKVKKHLKKIKNKDKHDNQKQKINTLAKF